MIFLNKDFNLGKDLRFRQRITLMKAMPVRTIQVMIPVQASLKLQSTMILMKMRLVMMRTKRKLRFKESIRRKLHPLCTCVS